MGTATKQRVTLERFMAIRHALKTKMPKKQILSEFGVGETTLRRIRRSPNYEHYELETIAIYKSRHDGKMPTKNHTGAQAIWREQGHQVAMELLCNDEFCERIAERTAAKVVRRMGAAYKLKERRHW